MFNAVESVFRLHLILCCYFTTVTHELSLLQNCFVFYFLCRIIQQCSGHCAPWYVFIETGCNYTAVLLTLDKMMRNELLMKTLPGAAQ